LIDYRRTVTYNRCGFFTETAANKDEEAV